MLQEAAQTNAASIQRKVQLKQEAEDENLRIAAYIAERDRKEQERQDELEAEARRKAEDVARLRAMQKKQAARAGLLTAAVASSSLTLHSTATHVIFSGLRYDEILLK